MNAFTCHLPATKVISNQKMNRIFAWAWLNSETWKLRFSVSSYCITIKPVIHRFPCFVPDLSFWPVTSPEMASNYIFLVLSSILSSCPSYSSQAENFLPLSLCQYILSCLEVPFLPSSPTVKSFAYMTPSSNITSFFEVSHDPSCWACFPLFSKQVRLVSYLAPCLAQSAVQGTSTLNTDWMGRTWNDCRRGQQSCICISCGRMWEEKE